MGTGNLSSSHTTEWSASEKKLIKLVKRNNEQGCADLLKMGNVDLTYQGENGWTALHFACWIGNFKIVNLLILNGANIDIGAKNDIKPLMVASSTGNHKIMDLLIKAGANIKTVDKTGSTCLHYAAQSNNMDAVTTLVNKGCPIDVKNNKSKQASEVTSSNRIRSFLKKQGNNKDEYFIPIFSYTFDKLKNIFTNDSNEEQDKKIAESSPKYRNDSMINRKVNPEDFEILSLLGKGSFGEVYLVRMK